MTYLLAVLLGLLRGVGIVDAGLVTTGYMCGSHIDGWIVDIWESKGRECRWKVCRCLMIDVELVKEASRHTYTTWDAPNWHNLSLAPS